MANNQTVIATAGLVSVAVGTGNSILQDKKAPSSTFLIGSGVAFLVLSAMANMGDSMAEIAKGLALGVMTTILLGDSGGIMDWFASREMQTQRRGPSAPKGSDAEEAQEEGVQLSARVTAFNAPFHPGSLPAFPGLPQVNRGPLVIPVQP